MRYPGTMLSRLISEGKSEAEARKQIRRWRYYRRYWRKKFGDAWGFYSLLEMHVL